MSKKGGLGKFIGGLALGAGIGLLFAPDKGENTRKALAKKVEELAYSFGIVESMQVKEKQLRKEARKTVKLLSAGRAKIDILCFDRHEYRTQIL